MISSKHRISLYRISLFVILVLMYSNKGYAQKEIPANIKELVSQGINAVDSAKVPNDIDRAIALFKKAIKIAPDFPDIHYYMGKTLSMLQGNTRYAVKELKKYIELYPSAPDKESVQAEIGKLEASLKLMDKTASLGFSLISMPDGVYIRTITEVPMHRVDVRTQRVQVGDKILKINDADVNGKNLTDILTILNEDNAAKVKLTIKRSENQLDVDMARVYNKRLLKVLDEDDLNVFITNSDVPVIVFWKTDTCSDCKKYYTKLTNALMANSGKLRAVEVNLSQNKMIDDEFGIDKETVPVISFYKSGKLTGKISGFQSDEFDDKVNSLLE